MRHVAAAALLLLMLAQPTFAAGEAPALSDSTVTYLHSDTTSTVRLATDAQGNVVAAPRYGPFGEALLAEALTEPGSPGFAGKRREPVSRLYDFHARYYDPHIGRFTSPDPVRVQDLLEPQRFNLYAYALNNPFRYGDPDGRQVRQDFKRDPPPTTGTTVWQELAGPVNRLLLELPLTYYAKGLVAASEGNYGECFEHVMSGLALAAQSMGPACTRVVGGVNIPRRTGAPIESAEAETLDAVRLSQAYEVAIQRVHDREQFSTPFMREMQSQIDKILRLAEITDVLEIRRSPMGDRDFAKKSHTFMREIGHDYWRFKEMLLESRRLGMVKTLRAYDAYSKAYKRNVPYELYRLE